MTHENDLLKLKCIKKQMRNGTPKLMYNNDANRRTATETCAVDGASQTIWTG